jgi:hypothetical protein
MNKPIKWQVKIEHLMACNCNWGCPCSFESPPTFGKCEGALAYKIVKGKYGNVILDGLKWIVAVAWPGAIHELKGRAVVYLDKKATNEKLSALEMIATGKAGGPIGIFMSTVTEGIEVKTVDIEFHSAGKKSWFRITDEINVAFEPIRNPVSKKEHHATVYLPTGLLNNKEDYFSSKIFSVNSETLCFEYPGRHAMASINIWKGP